jgi:hypothetical protein
MPLRIDVTIEIYCQEGSLMFTNALRRAGIAAFLLAALPVALPGDTPFARPELMRWGATTAELERALTDGKLCTKEMRTRPIVPPFLDHVKDRQVQIDCDGFMFQGKPRWVEFVIGDDSLEMVWVMTTKEEEEALTRAMIAAYGAPSHETKEYTAFVKHRAALRFKPAEVLFYSERIAGEAEGWFAK